MINFFYIKQHEFYFRVKNGIRNILRDFFSKKFKNVFVSDSNVRFDATEAKINKNALINQSFKQLGKKSFLFLNGSKVYRRKI